MAKYITEEEAARRCCFAVELTKGNGKNVKPYYRSRSFRALAKREGIGMRHTNRNRAPEYKLEDVIAFERSRTI